MKKGLRTDVIALAALALAAALGIALLILRGPGGRADPLGAVPADAFLVATVDVAALARSPLGEALVGELRGGGGARAGTLLGVESITETCGFDPLPELRAIAVALPEGEERGEFGVAVSGVFTKDALARCAKAVIAKRGGAPSSRLSGTFTVVSDAKTPGGAEVAFRDGGPYLVGRGAWLGRMIDAAEERIPSALSGGAHASLRADLATRDRDAEALRVTAILPHDVRERLQREMAREANGAAGKGDGNKAMAGVLGVSAAALGLHAGRAHEDSRFVAELRCDTESACEAVSTLILHTRLLASGNLAYRLFGLGPLIDNLEVQRAGTPATALYVRSRAPADDLAKMLERALHPASSRDGSSRAAPSREDPSRGGEDRGDKTRPKPAAPDETDAGEARETGERREDAGR